jgi:hypothetical protein
MTLLDGSGARLDAMAVEFSGRGMRLAVDSAVPPGTLVKIDTPDALYLAEVCYVNAQEGGWWTLGLKVDQVLTGGASLARVRHFVDPLEIAELVHPEPTLTAATDTAP